MAAGMPRQPLLPPRRRVRNVLRKRSSFVYLISLAPKNILLERHVQTFTPVRCLSVRYRRLGYPIPSLVISTGTGALPIVLPHCGQATIGWLPKCHYNNEQHAIRPECIAQTKGFQMLVWAADNQRYVV